MSIKLMIMPLEKISEGNYTILSVDDQGSELASKESLKR